MTPRRALLRRNRQLRILLLARVVSFAGDQLTSVVLTLVVHARSGLGAAVSALLVAQALPHLLGPVAGAVVDRCDQRTVLRATEAARAAVVSTIALTLPALPVLLPLVAVNATLASVLRPAGRSAIPALVPAHELGAANASLATGANVGLALGPAAGGLLVAWTGASAALFVDVGTSVAAAVALGALRPLPPEPTVDAVTPPLLADVREGLAHTWRRPTTRVLSLCLLLGVALAGTVLVAGVFLIRDALGGGPYAYGLFTGAWGLGMIAVSVVLAGSRKAAAPGRWLPLAFAAQATALLAAGAAPAVWAAVGAATLGGVGNGLEDIATDTLLQQQVPKRLLGRVVGAVYAASFAGELTAYATAGPLVDLLGPRIVLVGAGLGLAVLAAWLAREFRRLLPSAPAST